MCATKVANVRYDVYITVSACLALTCCINCANICHYYLFSIKSTLVVPSLSYSPQDPRFTCSNPAGVDEFFQSIKTLSMSTFGREVKPLVPCRRLHLFRLVLYQSCYLAALAQMVACLPLIQQVRGSIPGGVVNFNLKIFNLGARRGGHVHFLIARLYITVLD